MGLFNKNKQIEIEENNDQKTESSTEMNGATQMLGEDETGLTEDYLNRNKQKDEEEKNMDVQKKTRFMYIAMDKEGIVLLNDGDSPYFTTIEEGGSPSWPKEIRDKAVIDDNYRMEVPDVSENITNKKERDKETRKIKQTVQDQLRTLAETKIDEAIAKKHEGDVPAEHNVQRMRNDGISDEKTNNNFEGSIIKEKHSDAMINENTGEDSKCNDNYGTGSHLIIDAITSAEKRLNADLNASTEDIIGSVGESLKEQVFDLKKHAERDNKALDDKVRKYAEDATRIMADRTQKSTENIISRVNDTARTITDEQSKISSKTAAVDKHVSDLSESVESIEGNLRRLDQLDEVVKLLQDKGLVMSMDIPPINADEEDILNLVRYSQRITEQLGYAARDLIRKQAAFKSQEQNNVNEQNMMEKKLSSAHDNGVMEGKKQFIKLLISKYADVDAIKDSEEGHVHAIWTFLEEIGVEIDGDGMFYKGNNVAISKEEAERMTAIYAGINDAGMYHVKNTGLVFAGETVYKAEFEKVDVEENASDDVNQIPVL